MSTREFKADWEHVKNELKENDVLKLSSLLDLAENEELFIQSLEFCKEKRVALQIHDSVLEADVYMQVLELIQVLEQHRKEEMKKAQRIGIERALENKANGKGGYGRPKVVLPKDFAERVKECLKNCSSLEAYRKQTNLKRSTFYKYVTLVKKDIKYL